MATSSQKNNTPVPLKSVWKKPNHTRAAPRLPQTLVNGVTDEAHETDPSAKQKDQPNNSITNSILDKDSKVSSMDVIILESAIEAHEKDSVSSKDAAHGESSSQGHLTPTSSMTDEAQTTALPTPSETPAPVYRPAPLPAVNPWKARQENMERKRWKESQETPPAPLQMDRVVPKPPTNVSSKPGNNKPNGVVKHDAKVPSRRSTKHNNVVPPALEDSEAWPSPEVAASVEKDDRVKPVTTAASSTTTTVPPAKESPKEPAKEGESREAKEPRETKKKKWEKIEVNFQYDPPQSRRGRGGKFSRNGRGGGRDPSTRVKDGDRVDKEEKNRNAQRSDGEDASASLPRESLPVERRAQSLSFDPGHRHHDMPPQEWSMRGPYTQEPLSMNPEGWKGESSSSRAVPQETQIPDTRDVSAKRSQSPSSSQEKNPSSPTSKERDAIEPHRSPAVSPNDQNQFSDVPPQWDEQENSSALQNNIQYNQSSHAKRGGNNRGYRGRNGYSPIPFSQGQYMQPPQQVPFQGFYPPFYPPPMQAGFPPNGRSHSVPYYQPNSVSRYPQTGYPQIFPDYSRLGVQPVPVIDEDTKQRIIRQVEYYFSSENLFKDVFLRKKMDSQGFVPIQVLVQFNRMQTITSDVPTVLNALLSSSEVEVLYNSERGPLVRARHDPAKWIYPLDQRDENAKHAGPSQYYFQAHQESLRQMQEYPQYAYPQPYFFDAQYGFPTTPFRQQDQEPAPQVGESEPHSPVPMSPHFDPQNRKLSGEASVFVPSDGDYVPSTVNGDGAPGNPHSVKNAVPTILEEPEEPVDVLDEDSLSNLVITITDRPIIPALPINNVEHKPEREQDILRSPLQPVTWRFSDVTAATQASTSLSIKSGLSSLTAQEDTPPQNRSGETALTEKNLKKQLSQCGITEYAYTEFRSKALQSRQMSQKSNRDSPPMNHLYQFWSDFLCDYWVPAMYSEFMQFAVEDANQSRRTGLLKLFAMYERVLDVKFRTLLWNDFVRLSGEDYRNGHFSGIESVWRIRGNILARGRNVTIQDENVCKLFDAEIQHSDAFDRLKKEAKPASVLVPYTTGQSA